LPQWSDWYWLAIFIYSWFMLYLLSGPREVRSFLAFGVWSVLLAAAEEAVIRSHFAFWLPTAAALLGVNMLLLAGPRFVEGLLFVQTLPRQTSWQLPAVAIWSIITTLFELSAVFSGKAGYSLNNLLLALLLHLLRFAALLALWYGLNYERRAELLGEIYRRGRRRRLSRSLWQVSFIPLYFGMRFLTERWAKK